MAADWAKIKAEYLNGGISTRKLAEKHGVSYSSLRRRCEKEHWTQEVRAVSAKANAKIAEACAAKKAKKACKIDDAAELLLDQVVKIAGRSELTSKQLRELASTLKDLREIKGIKTDADLREQEARIKKLEREANTEQENKDISINIMGMNVDELGEVIG